MDSYEYVTHGNYALGQKNIPSFLFEHYLDETRRTSWFSPFIAFFAKYNCLLFFIFMQHIISIVNITIGVLIFIKLFSEKYVSLFLIFCGIYPLQYFMSNSILTEILAQFFITIGIYAYIFGKIKLEFIAISLLCFLKPAFIPLIFLYPIIRYLLINKIKFSILFLVVNCGLFAIIGLKHYSQFGFLHYSSMGTENAYQFNAAMVVKNDSVMSFNDSILKKMDFKTRYLFMRQFTKKTIFNNFFSYTIIHLKGCILACIDPGRYDLIAAFNLKNNISLMKNNASFLSTLKENIWIFIYIIFFSIIQVIKFLLMFFHGKNIFKNKLLIPIMLIILYCIIITGPVGSARYLFPVQILIAILATSFFERKKFN